MYYRFNGVDVDRYMIDGELRLALASARELDISALPPEGDSLDQHPSQIHSHGYRHRQSPASEVTRDGMPGVLLRTYRPGLRPT